MKTKTTPKRLKQKKTWEIKNKAKIALYLKQKQLDSVAKGLCRCGRKPNEGYKVCEGCRASLEKYSLKNKERIKKRQKEYIRKSLSLRNDPEYMARINEKIRIGLAKGL